jgi:TonB family protein
MKSETANDRFKREFGRWMWGGMMVAVAFHFGLFQFFPELTAEDLGIGGDVTPIDPLPRIDIPEPPDPIRRPPIPVVGDVDVDESVTIHKTTLDENPIPPPPPSEIGLSRDCEAFAVYTTAPRVSDRRRARAVVGRHYPPLLRDAGIGGTVRVEAFVDTSGRVLDARVVGSSGNVLLDEAALKAVRQFEYTPALNRDTKVSVWIEQLIIFESK